MSDFASIQRYSDDELYNELKALGQNNPVNSATRKVLERRLAKLKGILPEDSAQGGSEEEAYEEADYTLDDSMSGGRSSDGADVIRRRGRQGHDTFGNSFYVEEVDARPSDQARARRASETEELRSRRAEVLDHLAEDLKVQEDINKDLGGLDKEGSQGSRTVLTVLAILVVIAVFLVISYMTEGESADELIRMPQVKVAAPAPASPHVVPAEDPPV